MMALHLALLLLQTVFAAFYLIRAYYILFIQIEPSFALVLADLLIQILINYIVLKMGTSAQLRNYDCHLTQNENGGLRIVFKPKFTVDDASDTTSHNQLNDENNDAGPNDNSVIRGLMGRT